MWFVLRFKPPWESTPVPIHWETGWSLAGRGQWKKRIVLRQPGLHPRFLCRLVRSVDTVLQSTRDLSRYSRMDETTHREA